MSTLDHLTDLHASLGQTQHNLLERKTTLDLKLYERNSMNKVNFRSFLGKNFFCSSQDKYRKIRVPILAVFLKVLENKNDKNLQRIQKLKQLIYSASLTEIVNKHGITTEQLLAHFATIINELELGSQNIQKSFIKKINAEPFFDKIILESFYEIFDHSAQQTSLTSSISKWIKTQIGISIVFLDSQTENQGESVIFLRKNQKGEILRKLNSFQICSMTSIFNESTKDEVTPIKIKALNNPGQDSGSQSLLKSISSCESPSIRLSSKRKINQQLVAISLQNSVQLMNVKQNMQSPSRQYNENFGQPIIKRRTQQSESRFWKIFCCGGD